MNLDETIENLRKLFASEQIEVGSLKAHIKSQNEKIYELKQELNGRNVALEEHVKRERKLKEALKGVVL